MLSVLNLIKRNDLSGSGVTVKLKRIKTLFVILALAATIIGQGQAAKALNMGRVACSEGGAIGWQQVAGNIIIYNARTCKGALTIPEGTIDIGDVFANTGVTKIELASTVTRVMAGAFANTGITEFGITGGITSVEKAAFKGSKLASVHIAAGATGISAIAFDGAAALKAFSADPLSNSYASVSGVLFDKTMTSLIAYPLGKTDKKYVIPDTVTTIAENAFAGQKHLAELEIPKSVTTINENAFLYASAIKKYKIPANASLGTDALRGLGVDFKDQTFKCSGGGTFLTKLDTIATSKSCRGTISIPGFVKEIATAAFKSGDYAENTNAKLTSLTVPKNVRVIGADSFNGNPLKTIKLAEGVEIIGDYAFIQDLYTQSALRSLSLPSTITYIGFLAFNSAGKIPSITIPSAVQFIGDQAFTGLSLGKVTIKPGIKNLGSEAFYAVATSNISLPNSIESIGESAFDYADVQSFSLPNSLKKIGPLAFRCLQNTPVLVIPASVTEISSTSFKTVDCSALAKPKVVPKIYFLGNAPAIDGDAPGLSLTRSLPMNIYVSPTATGFDIDPTTNTWHGFNVLIGSPTN